MQSYPQGGGMSMEARFFSFVLALVVCTCTGASYRTANFIVTASTATMAKQVAHAAEFYRKKQAIEWLGYEIPKWQTPCPIRVKSGRAIGAAGSTSFSFEHGLPSDWEMHVQGTPARILDSVIPHEVTHTVFASHFRQPLPRWADEGACTTTEHLTERQKQHVLLHKYLSSGRGIPFNRMFRLSQYPTDILPLYAQGYSVARFLIAQGGKQMFIRFLETGIKSRNWDNAVTKHYGFSDLSDLQLTWNDWVRRGSPKIQLSSAKTQLVSNKLTSKLTSKPARALVPIGFNRENN